MMVIILFIYAFDMCGLCDKDDFVDKETLLSFGM